MQIIVSNQKDSITVKYGIFKEKKLTLNTPDAMLNTMKTWRVRQLLGEIGKLPKESITKKIESTAQNNLKLRELLKKEPMAEICYGDSMKNFHKNFSAIVKSEAIYNTKTNDSVVITKLGKMFKKNTVYKITIPIDVNLRETIDTLNASDFKTVNKLLFRTLDVEERIDALTQTTITG